MRRRPDADRKGIASTRESGQRAAMSTRFAYAETRRRRTRAWRPACSSCAKAAR